MTSESKRVALSEVCEIVSSKRIFAADYRGEGIPFYRGKEISQLARGEKASTELFISEVVYQEALRRTGPVKSGDILLTAVGTLGNPYQVRETDLPFYFKDGNVLWMRNFSAELNPTFLFYWLNSPHGREKVFGTAIGSTQAALTISALGKLEVLLPSLEQQSGVVQMLALIDRKIELNRESSKILEAICQFLFKSWLIDFDPVKAKMAGETPVGMDAETAALFPDSMEDSELGEIPAGWSVGTLVDFFNLVMGQSPPGSAYNSEGGGEPFFQGRAEFGERFPTQRLSSTLGNRRATKGDVLVSVRAPVGDQNQALVDCIIGRGLAAIRHKSGSQAYSYEFVRSIQGQLDFFNGQGSVFGSISKRDFESLQVLEPPDALIQAFDSICSPIDELLRNLHVQNESLAGIRDALLPRLVSGELEIPDEILAA